jgi:hypothetical protein
MVPLLIAGGSFLLAWFPRFDKNPSRRPEADVPRLACAEPSVDVGEIGVSKVEHTYTLRNPCGREVRITKIGKSCGCLEPHFDRTTIGPGETTHVGITVHVKAKNPAAITRFRERLSIHCDDQDDRLELELSGTYVPPLYYETTQINLIAPENTGEPFYGKFEVFLRRDKDVKIPQIQVRTIACEAAVDSRIPVGTGDFDKAVIVIRGKLSEAPLPQTGTLEIQTTSVDVPVIQVPIVLFNPRTDEIKIEPPRLAIGIVVPDSQIVREVAFRLPAGADYEVEGVTSSSPRIVVTRQQTEGDGEKRANALGFRCRIDCKGVTGKIEENIVFRLKNGTRRQSYTVPVSGFVKPIVPGV